MATITAQVKNNSRQWECKQCHQMIAENDTVAYHLVDRVLYGWCESCFGQRADKSMSELAA
ncbi:MAG TPA: hypothetical protein VNI02_19775 [Blastocatellia bacterium]|nr:hypothetical protein [Blastocatellia bacterium]